MPRRCPTRNTRSVHNSAIYKSEMLCHGSIRSQWSALLAQLRPSGRARRCTFAQTRRNARSCRMSQLAELCRLETPLNEEFQDLKSPQAVMCALRSKGSSNWWFVVTNSPSGCNGEYCEYRRAKTIQAPQRRWRRRVRRSPQPCALRHRRGCQAP